MICVLGCIQIPQRKSDDFCVVSKCQAIKIAWDALRNKFSEDFIDKYVLERLGCYGGYWIVTFVDPNSVVLGDHLAVVVYDDQTADILYSQ